jgi:uncharacterized delta-60 repeat protein
VSKLLKVLLLGCVLTLAAAVPALAQVSVEGERFNKPSGVSVAGGKGYSGGKALRIFSEKASATKQVTITEASTVDIRARADQTDGSPTLTLRVDGVNSGTRRIDSVALDDYVGYGGVTLQPGTYTIGLKAGNVAQGRNVFVDVVSFPAKEQLPSEAVGELDPGFSGDGQAVFVPDPSYVNVRVSDVLTTASDGVVAVGHANVAAGFFGEVLRLDSSGNLDSSFSTDGRAKITTVPRVQFTAGMLQPDGKIVTAGWHSPLVDDQTGSVPLLVRYLPDGTLDGTFGDNGVVTGSNSGISDPAYAEFVVDAALQSDGKIVTVATSRSSGPQEIVLRRWNADGSVDSTFGTNGRVSTAYPTTCGDSGTNGCPLLASSVVIQPDGKIVVVGELPRTNVRNAAPVFARYNPDGSLNTSFGASVSSPAEGFSGIVRVDVGGGSPTALALQDDGKLVAAGIAEVPGIPDAQMLMLRLNSDGSLDTTFGTGGIINEEYFPGTRYHYPHDIVIQDNQKIVAAHAVFEYDPLSQADSPRFGLTRHNPDGSLDTSFGDSGALVTPRSQGVATPYAVALDSQQRIVVGGQESDSLTSLDYAIYRYR